MILTNTGVLKLMQRIKSFITSQLNTKANSVHTHTISEIDDLSSLQMGGGGSSKSEVDTLLNDYIPKSGGGVLTGAELGRTVNNDELRICGGTTYNQGASIILYGKDKSESYFKGRMTLRTSDSSSTANLILYPGGSLTWDGNYLRPDANNYCKLGAVQYRFSELYAATGTINTSDSRLKNTITVIDDSLLDAWESIQPKQYKFNDATESKGEQARFHTGYLAQDIEKACTDNNIDATRYGLFCYDSWEEEPEITEDVEVEKDGVKTTEKRIVQPKREKGDAYSLRYEEALVVECAYLRREISRLKEELKQLKAK